MGAKTAMSAVRLPFAVSLLICAAMVGTPSQACAQYFGAVSYSPSTAAVGWGYDFLTKKEAEEAAMRNCRQHAADCKITATVENGCIAIAVGDRDYASRADRSKQRALRMSMVDCLWASPRCEVLHSICTTRSRS